MDESGPADDRRDESLVRAVPGLARIALAAWRRSAEWTVGTSLRAGSRLVRAAGRGESPSELFTDAGSEVREYVRRLLEIVEVSEGHGEEHADDHRAATSNGTTDELRRRGAELLRRSADVHFEGDEHPAYGRILDNLAPDEARILRLLALKGPQPSVDVRTGTFPISPGSQLVAPGLTMIAAEAGCRHPDRVHAYLNNLYRLGLIWFSREPLEDPLQYQVLEAQPHVSEAMEKAGRSRTVRRSIHLTAFGRDFCGASLPLDTDEIEALSGHAPAEASNGEETED
jgi:Abortive infection alpha